MQVNSAERDCCRCANWWSAQETEAGRLHVISLVDSSAIGNLTAWQERVYVEEVDQSISVHACVELGLDVRDVVMCLLEEHRIEGAAHGRDQLRRPAAADTSVPL